jgi:cell cycle sensor histidine kinase DivJ
MAWSGGWLAMVVAAGLALPPGAAWNIQWALAVAGLPALAGLLLARRDDEGARDALIGLWGLSIGAAVVLGGGLAGPLAVWLLAPLAAAVVLGGRRTLAMAAALVVAAAGAAVLARAGGVVAPQAAPAWQPLFALAAVAGAFAGAGAVTVGRAARRQGALDEATRALAAAVRHASAGEAREAQLQATAREAQDLNAGKSRFLANMSHELRTPLNAVIGFSDIMRSQMFGPLGEKYLEYVGLIHESGGHLLDLINDLLDMSKIEAHRYELAREVFDAREPVAGAMRLTRGQADAARVTLRGDLPAAPLRVVADARALKQIVLNLVANAVKFTPAGGEITVTLGAEGADLLLVVADTGVGIAPEDLERLGRPYEQAGGAGQKARGAGLGLSLVRAFSELHGGDMTIASTLGEGTRVEIRLPVLLPPEPARAPLAGVPLGDNVVSLHPRR